MKNRRIVVLATVATIIALSAGITQPKARLNGRLVQAVEQHDMTAARNLLRRGADANALQPGSLWLPHGKAEWHYLLSSDGARPYRAQPILCVAVMRNDAGMVRLLLDHGTDVNVRDRFGQPPLYVASARGRPDLVRLLLTHGADVRLRNEGNRQTPLQAAPGGAHSPAEVARLLRLAGAAK